MVSDIHPGDGSSDPADLTYALGAIYFTADDGMGRAIWTTDGSGSAAGAERVGPTGSVVVGDFPEPRDLTAAWGTLFFTAEVFTAEAGGRELWMSDGTPEGTVLVKDICQGFDPESYRSLSSDPADLLNVNGTLFFTAVDSVYREDLDPPRWVRRGRDLWKSDGTAEGTVKLHGSVASSLADVNGTLYFGSDDGGWSFEGAGRELWKSDGTPAGTVRVADLRPGIQGSNPEQLTNVNGRLFFTIDDGATGREPWVLVGEDFKTVDFQTAGDFSGVFQVPTIDAPYWQTIYTYAGTATVDGALVYDSPEHGVGFGAGRAVGSFTQVGFEPQPFEYGIYGGARRRGWQTHRMGPARPVAHIVRS